MKLHPRVAIVQQAHHELDSAVLDIIGKHKLTYMELFSIFNQVQASWIRYGIRNERHPDHTEKPGGLE